MFDPVFAFACKPHTSASREVLTHVDDTICQAHATDPSTQVTRVVNVDARDCIDPVLEIVSTNDGVCRIECDVEARSHRVVAYHLCVNVQRFLDRIGEGGFPSEEHVINLSRMVWRDARIPCSPRVLSDPSAVLPEEDGDSPDRLWRSGDCTLYAHQEATVRWMRSLEARIPHHIRYSGNIRVAPGWYIDTECECITQDASPREAVLTGGICGSRPGSGKTAMTLRLVAGASGGSPPRSGGSYASAASLIILPINLLSQWSGEIEKFLHPEVRVRWMVRSQDLKGTTLSQLCGDYDLVLTTFYFLRSCPAYLEMVDAALGGRPRSRATLSAWMRQSNHSEPVLEAVVWRRIIVDEVHETFENARDMRVLRLFSTCCLWGLTGTPALEAAHSQALYSFLQREKSPHPNLTKALIEESVWVGESSSDQTVCQPLQTLRLVEMTREERMHMEQVDTVEEEIRLTSFVDRATSDVTDPEAEFKRARMRERAARIDRIEGYRRTIDILGNTISDLQGDRELTQGVRDVTMREIEKQRELCTEEERRLGTLDEREHAMRERLDALETSGDESKAGIHGVGSKMRSMGDLLRARRFEPIILFVQWKSMMRGIRSYLSHVGVRVLALDGNGRQRETTLNEFIHRGGVLVLCMEDSFAGLHLPQAQMIVFAHAIVGDIGMVKRLERQAIARCVRPGQTSDVVDVVSLVVSESDEEVLWRDTHGRTVAGVHARDAAESSVADEEGLV